MLTAIDTTRAEILIEALPYIKRFSGKIIVVKYGGSAMINEKLRGEVIDDLVLLKLIGFKPILIHGGGKEINRWSSAIGLEPHFVDGLRVTDEKAMELVEMALAKVNQDLVTLIQSRGIRSVGISGKDGNLLKAEKRKSPNADLGLVGEIHDVDPKVIYDLLDADYLPVIFPIGMDSNGTTYNINADEAASSIAIALNAEKLVFLSDVEGVRTDPYDPLSIAPELHIDEADKLISNGMITGGMIPKIKNCIEAVKKNVRRVHILDGRISHCLLLEIFSDRGCGTAILCDDEKKYYHTLSDTSGI